MIPNRTPNEVRIDQKKGSKANRQKLTPQEDALLHQYFDHKIFNKARNWAICAGSISLAISSFVVWSPVWVNLSIDSQEVQIGLWCLGKGNNDTCSVNLTQLDDEFKLHLAVILMLFFSIFMTLVGILLSIVGICRHDLLLRIYNVHSAGEFFVIAALALVCVTIVYPLDVDKQLEQLVKQGFLTQEQRPTLLPFFRFIRSVFSQSREAINYSEQKFISFGIAYVFMLISGFLLFLTSVLINLDIIMQALVKPRFKQFMQYFIDLRKINQ
ncbi:hypothetical protein Ciccas_014179 [Cichlidogyrus casuarinus]|uniref:Uncharacterized protein n=1 Tax=Cichlidogyrus casuarinus TaxID=1844966 RepID=A0ABD2PNK1_9PLAT